MNARNKLRLRTILAVSLCASASPGAVIPFSPLPVGVMTSIPGRAPAHVGAADHVPGLFVAQAPPQHGSPGYKRIEILDSKRDAQEFSSKGYVSAQTRIGIASKRCVFFTDETSAAGDAWPTLARGEISHFAGSGQNPILGVHVETLEDGSTPGEPASLGIVDAWLDTRSRGLKLVAKSSIPLGTVAEGPLGIRVLAARSDDTVHFVVLPPAQDPSNSLAIGGQFERAIIESGGEVGTSQCRHSRLSLRALPGAGQHAIVSFQHVEPAPREAADGDESDDSKIGAFATARTRLVQVHLSASRNASPAAPVVSVSFRVDSPKPFGS